MPERARGVYIEGMCLAAGTSTLSSAAGPIYQQIISLLLQSPGNSLGPFDRDATNPTNPGALIAAY